MATSVLIGLLCLVGFLVLIFIGVPISFAMAISGLVGFALIRSPAAALSTFKEGVLNTFSNYTTSVVPMFVLMGELATEAGIGNDLFDCFQALNGHRKAGLANAAQVVCAIFGAICGSTAATGAMMSRVAYPQMQRYGYSEELSTGAISAGSCLASLIPPSLSLITYGLCAETSIGKLFVGGILTGILLMVLFIITIQVSCAIKPSLAPEKAPKKTFKEKWTAIRKGGFIEIILVFAIAMGGMFSGWITATEAGAIGCFGMLIIAIIFKRFTWKVMTNAIKNTLVMTGFVYCMLSCAKMMASMFTLSRIPTALAAYVAQLSIGRIWIILILTLIYLVLGGFIDGVPLLLLTTPVFLPIVQAMGFDSVWYGCYMVVIIGLGGITPPVGAQCYVVAGSTKAPLVTVFKGSLPFIGAYVACAIIMALVPGVATWLPSLMY